MINGYAFHDERPHWVIADGYGWADFVMTLEALNTMANILASASITHSDVQFEQWWDANLADSRAFVRWGPAVGQGSVERLPDGGVVLAYPDGRRGF